MKLTKKLETEILKAYNTVWDSYLKGDMRTFASMLDENCYIIGSAAGEVFSNKKAAVKYYKSTAGQITGKAEFRNRKIKVMPVEKGVMVNEKADFYLLIDDQWTFYGPGRISSLFHKKNNKWKVIHQHGSFPDSKTEEGEQVNTDKIKAENIQLRNAVKRRTEELENKNRELEIEASLERVRARAMSMQSSDELVEVANVMRQQMVELGQSGFDTAAVHLYSDDPEYFDSWYSFRQGDPVTGKIVTGKTKFKKDACKMLREMVKAYHSKESDYTIKGSGEKLREWFSFLAKTIPEIKINLDKNPRSNYIHFSDFSGGSLVMATYEPPTKDSMLLQKRCAVVFDLAYRRYIDLKKAEAQAREAQIEAALERVRSRSMGMQKSSELVDVVHLLDSEITGLGIMVDNTSIITDFSEFEKGLNNWTALRGKSYLEKFHIPYNDDFVVTKLMDAITNGVDYYTEKYSRVEKNKYFKWLFKYSDFKKIPNERQQFVFDTPGWTRAIVISKNSLLVFQRYKFEEFTEEEGGIFKRFGKVFEQSYTRFLDLQKAEEQAREAGIELSLERVRAKAMAMQKPSEFVDVINIIGEQLIHLGFDIDWANFGANGFDISEGIDIWNFGVVPGASPISARVFFPYFDHPVFTTAAENVNEFLNGGRDLITVTLDKQAKDTWLDHMFTNTIFKDIPEEYRVIQYGKPGYTTSNISLKDTWLSIGKFDIKNFTDEQHAIFRRFANAFGQAYTRFLDLQNAEAQAKEAQIEAALERVRARSMAMHHSSELHAVADVLFQQLRIFGGDIMNAGIALCTQDADEDEYWLSSDSGFRPVISIPHTEDPVQKKLYEDWKNKSEFFSIAKGGDELKAHYNYMQSVPSLKPFFKEGPDWSFPTWQKWHAAYFSHGYLFMITLKPYEEEKILVRFAKVFEQAYTRFLDLQKAEAQAREAQIEAGLERVRSRAMAMQSSEQLRELIGTVFTELTKLDIVLTRCLIMIYDPKSNDSVWWMANSEAPTQPIGLKVQYHEYPSYLAYVNAWKQKELKWTYTLEGNTKKEWDDFLFVETELSHLPDFVIAGMKAPDRVYLNASFNSFGNLTLATLEPLSAEHFDIMLRFAKVFDLTYTRFNDLKQAEAQAREAQIELALERVRARTMAMHKSEELAETAEVLYHQLKELGDDPERITIGLLNEDTGVITWWATDQGGSKLNIKFQATIDEPTVMLKLYNGWKAKNESLVIDLSGRELADWVKYCREVIGVPIKEELLKNRRVQTAGFFSHGWLMITSPEPTAAKTINILERFASVFNLTYRRFLDLQKAEAQAREAQIEAALEKVRASAMAMHNSNDISSTTTIIFIELKKLGIQSIRCGIGLLSKKSPAAQVYAATTTPDRELATLRRSISMTDHPALQQQYESWLKQENYIQELKQDELRSYYQLPFFHSSANYIPPENFEQSELGYYIPFSEGVFYAWTKKGYSNDEINILNRFKAIVDLTFRRYLDLQKAEAQARDAQIEASLERVRASAMAMHRSDELSNVLAILFEQFDVLKIQPVDVHLDLFDLEKNTFSYRATGKEGKRVIAEQIVDLNSRPEWQALLQKWKNGKPNTVDFSYYPKEVIKELMTFFPDIWAAMPEDAIMSPEDFPDGIFDALGYCKFGYIGFHHHRKATEEEERILIRFANEFERLYQRFLDLQKAEANAREAQIEVSLERVRAKAMAMHSSKDLAETLSVFYRELKSLSVIPIRCGVALMDNETRMAELTTMNTTGEGDSIEIIGKIKMTGHPVLDGVFESWLVQKEYHAVLRGNQIKEYYQVLKPQIDYLDYSQDEAQFGYYFMFNEGDVYAWTEKELTEDELTIYRRFTTVISLTYKRYKDLQQAEAQTREAKIEAGLERVRSKTMAMHNSDDVGAATATMFTELEKLGIQNLRGGITIIKAGDKQEVWGITNLPDGRTIRSIGEFDMHLHALWRELLKAKVNNGDYNYYRLAGKDKEDYVNILNTTPNYLSQPIKEFPDVHVQSYFFGEGAIWTNSLEPHSEEDKQVMKRFASVFSLTFRRYQDLKKAEAQTREATIETALEKVRGKAMAMHNSNDLTATASLVFTELRKLGISPMRCGVGMLNKENRKGLLYTGIASEEGDSLSQIGWVLLDVHPVLRSVYDHWIRGEDYFPVLKEEVLRSFYEQLKSGFVVPEEQTKYEHHGYFLPFSEGVFYGWSEKPFTESELKILKRFASVIDLTFRRYIELQKSEGNAREAVKQAALDRVRAEIASMRTINDLDRITPLIWNELNILGIPFIRCGVFIMDNEQQLIHTFLSTPDGKAIAAFHLPYDTPGNLEKVVANWKKNKKYIDHWDEAEFIQFADILVKEGALVSSEQYLKTIPHGGFYLHFLPFLQGMLYVGNTEQLKEEEIELIQHVADAFSTAYARYEDFNKLESAKQQVEKTLTDLKQTQQQLVQAEKMASLGELTAGIAHEIQNPLNFVNNFSEVSKELLDEMKTELETGNTEDAKGIADDVIQNLEKINHHGKRADAIVKSMLQHSRSSSGKKEPTDINALADEYLRLAYHGLRAKDKSFNAKFETEFDDSIGKVNIISQDIGRVLVNLINNAFYAVSERKKQESNGYEPTVEVVTKKMNDKIEIKVKDNGNGIPKKVLDKIFQPFFTTKPTGQGTGLGLSLAYDIVTKGHGGELKVETKEGEGTEFIIQLPVN